MSTGPAAYDAYVFDLYGTLCEIGSLETSVAAAFGPERAREALDLWRTKQIGYAWTGSLMERYATFDVLTANALDYTAARFGVDLGEAQRANLIDAWTKLPVYAEVPQTLAALRARGATLAVLSNGIPLALESTLQAAGIRDAFTHVLSVDSVKMYKPSPRVYALAVDAFDLPAHEIGFVSSNSWDATGAASFGFSAIWCNRTAMPHETFGAPPAHTIARLDELIEAP